MVTRFEDAQAVRIKKVVSQIRVPFSVARVSPGRLKVLDDGIPMNPIQRNRQRAVQGIDPIEGSSEGPNGEQNANSDDSPKVVSRLRDGRSSHHR